MRSDHTGKYKRILIVGTTASGKSTLAQTLSAQLNLPHINLDALHWGPNWTKRDSFEDEVQAALESEA